MRAASARPPALPRAPAPKRQHRCVGQTPGPGTKDGSLAPYRALVTAQVPCYQAALVINRKPLQVHFVQRSLQTPPGTRHFHRPLQGHKFMFQVIQQNGKTRQLLGGVPSRDRHSSSRGEAQVPGAEVSGQHHVGEPVGQDPPAPPGLHVIHPLSPESPTHRGCNKGCLKPLNLS